MLRDAGYNLIMSNGKITIKHKSSEDSVRIQEKLQTLIENKKISLDTFKIGILYSSPSFEKYATDKKTADGKISPNASSQDFIEYVNAMKNAGNKNPDIVSILESRSMLSGVNMQQAIKGFQDMGQVAEWKKNNEKILSQVETQLSAVVTQSPVAPQSVPRQLVAPAEPNTTLTGKLTQDGVTGGHVTGVV
jgi:hypothetical protein